MGGKIIEDGIQPVQKTLRNYDGWVETERRRYDPFLGGGPMPIGRYRDIEGRGLYGLWLRKTSSKVTMYVLYNGWPNVKYFYRNVDISLFDSRMNRWQNLHFCNGWDMDKADVKIGSDDLMLQAVAERKKPVGFIVQASEKIAQYKKLAAKIGLDYHVHPHFDSEDWEQLWITNLRGTVGENFDLEAIVKAYELLGIEPESFANELFRIKNEPINEAVRLLEGWDRVFEDSQIVKIGLLLGYPLESTASVLQGTMQGS